MSRATELLIKLAAIITITAAAWWGVAGLLAISDHWLMQLAALLVWSCGGVPLIYLIWRLELRRNIEHTNAQSFALQRKRLR